LTAQSVVALIPARSGSKRVPDKNIKRLGEHPLLAYTIAGALQSGVFTRVLVSTDSDIYARIALHYGAEVPFMRPQQLAGDTSPDIQWVTHALEFLRDAGETYDCFSLLRPTSPFRLPETIVRAWNAFRAETGVDSLRAVEKCSEHPGKMWVIRGGRMTPLLPLSPPEQPWHSSQYPSLPAVYVQNASLEISWCRNVLAGGTIAGHVLMPFISEGFEGVDVNVPFDWIYADHLVQAGLARLPHVPQPPFEM
jgi:CMP-N,N'-diacetyllegionaminic acid synthase